MKLKTAKEIPIGGKIINAGNSKEVKTGGWKSKKPVIKDGACVGCLRCAAYCPDMAIKLKEITDGKGIKKTVVDHIDLDHCKGCGICANECPLGVIVMESLESN
jgi:pyruvate ferredoxin oxidoreductase delta subunit